ncbi:MAG: RnfABCDGE type electron transport complex subunit C [Lachnospiraceae bacterium]|nr:RnfABCDGE type electron transport complex subunit C [Lachnospiraceae bacterium]
MGKEQPKFFGGIHPTDGWDKALTADKKIISYVPESVRICMKQGLGPACTCVVKPGDRVEQGQIIGESAHFMSAAIHSSVTGTVVAADDQFCEIKTEACNLVDEAATYYKEWADVSAFTRDTVIEQLEKGGLVGMGGAGFPTHLKYETKDQITHVLINAAECEPFLSCDEHVMLEQGMAVLNGVQLLKKAAGAEQAVICMEDNKAHCKEYLEFLLKGHETGISIVLLPTRYPQGGEKQLIAATMGVEIPTGKLPSSVGAIVSNIQTAKAAADMVLGNRPLISRCITITGDVQEPGNYLVPLGTDIGELVRAAGDVKNPKNKVILGGPMTGRCIGEDLTAEQITKVTGESVSKVSGGLVVLAGTHTAESGCIRCGSCEDACPAGLTPFKIDAAMRKENISLCQTLNATECIGCGCCSYVCPSKRELTHTIVTARDTVRMKLREEATRG